jgi:beta-glucosidase
VSRYHRNSTIGDLLDNPRTADKVKKFSSVFGMDDALGDNPEMSMAMLINMPLRVLVGFGQGKYTEEDLAKDLQEFNALAAE